MDSRDDPGAYTEEELEQLRRIEADLEAAKAVKFAEPTEGDKSAQLRDIEERAHAAKETFHKHTAEGGKGSFVGPEGGKSLGKGLQIAYAIIGVPLVGFGVGWLIDQKTGGKFWEGILTIAGATIAVWYAVRSANKD